MTRFALALLVLLGSMALIAGCNEEPEINTLEDAQKASEGKEPHPDSGEAPGGKIDLK